MPRPLYPQEKGLPVPIEQDIVDVLKTRIILSTCRESNPGSYSSLSDY
jgi:hypothetical protein